MKPLNQYIGDVSFQLREKHNFDWIKEYGTVFKVFDQQDSGNLCFGIIQNGQKRFLKYAGAKTIHYEGEPEQAVQRLKQAASIYKRLQHESLITFKADVELGEGYALIFEWVEGECLHSHWTFPPPEKYTHPDSPYYRFKQLPITQRLGAMRNILSFHQYVEEQHVVAIDFYDGSILYDFKTDQLFICDIDFYHSKPYINEMGRMWGSNRFMSPEEFELGASIDERTNVYNMGAIAFSLLGGELDRSYEKWEAGEALYKVMIKAVENDPRLRFASVTELLEAWDQSIS
ncbi:protein kinase domain-containing protein [Alkalicoccobacillus porphyridii]|uniref:Protein kinase n=1 Tax=Alkalicoccobacillus porphyridii TaxID=2597270 RepID=A0A553ZV32_9BACI|nr:protein kinase [Alkalicoccobacillus porphyridii]TSB45344.1 protein kinase [Alkalicoccobacillus porphyridii]